MNNCFFSNVHVLSNLASKTIARYKPSWLMTAMGITSMITIYLFLFDQRMTIFETLGHQIAITIKISNLKPCNHTILFSGARQGSTWFINSIDKCKYSLNRQHERQDEHQLFVSDVFRKTEIWHQFGKQMDANDTLQYVLRNNSIKIMPVSFRDHVSEVRSLLKRSKSLGIHVLVLRRDFEATWISYINAVTSNVWNGSTRKSMKAKVENHEQSREQFEKFRREYDRQVNKMLEETDVNYDLFDYDTVKDTEIIVAENNRCYIRNCNFLE